MKFSSLIAATLLAAAGAATASHKVASFSGNLHARLHYENRFLSWMTQHGKSFNDAEYEQRLQTFAHSDDLIARHNADPKATFTMAHNPFSHMSWEEFRASKGLGRPLQAKPNMPVDISDVQTTAVQRKLHTCTGVKLPTEWNWHDQGAVTPVKNQESCGSCWAFSTTGAMEGAYYVKNGYLRSFSEQMLVDCDTNDSGCNGGLMDFSFHWIKDNGGICSEEDYPYTGTDGDCEPESCVPVSGTGVKDWTDVDTNEKALMEAVYQQPVSVAIEADESAFQFYSDGVLTAACGTNLDHGVLLTGFGAMDIEVDGENKNVEYWLVKNSWGDEWGSEGYIRLLRSEDSDECGILMSASYPNLE